MPKKSWRTQLNIHIIIITAGVDWQLSNLTAVRLDSCQTWQLSNWKFQAKFHVFFRTLVARYIWSSSGTLFLNKKHSILELIFRKLQTISKRSQPASICFLLIRNATFWVLMKICVKHQDQRVDYFVDFDQQRKNEKSVVICTYEKKKGIIKIKVRSKSVWFCVRVFSALPTGLRRVRNFELRFPNLFWNVYFFEINERRCH